MTEAERVEQPATGAPNRLLRPCPLGPALQFLGWASLLTTCLLSSPIVENLFAPDGQSLSLGVTNTLEPVRLVAGVAATAFLALSLHSRLARKPLPIRVGDAIVALLALALGLFAVEAAARVRHWRQWGSAVATPLPGARFQLAAAQPVPPGVYGYTMDSDYDPAYHRRLRVSINRYGLRGPLPVVPKPPGLTRIVCVGGSTTYGWTVSDGHDWPSRLHALLSKRVGVEVVNGGRPGATTRSNFHYLRERLLQLEPDVVLLYEGFNDMWRGVTSRFTPQSDFGRVDPSLPWRPQPLDLGPPRPWPVRLSFAAYDLGRRLEEHFGPHGPIAVAATTRFRFDPAVVAVYEHNLSAMIGLCRSRGVLPVVLTFAGCDDPGRPEAERRLRLKWVIEKVQPLDVETAQEGIDLYRETSRRVARSHGVPLVDAAALMSNDTSFYVDSIHLREEGEAELARVLQEPLEQVLALSR